MLAALASAVLAIGWSSAASADIYTVNICSPTAAATDAFFGPFPVGEDFIPIVAKFCSSPTPGFLESELLEEASTGVPVAKGDGLGWELRAPEGTLIRSLSFQQNLAQGCSSCHSFLDWELFTNKGKVLEHVRDDRDLSGETNQSFPEVDASSVIALMYCPASIITKFSCPEPGGPDAAVFRVLLRNIFAVLDDLSPPAVSRPEVPDTVRGTVEVPIAAIDAGSGLNEITLVVDGVVLGRDHDENGGKCRPPYGFVTPCVPEDAASFSLDTSKLPDGPHEMYSVARDASGQETLSPITRFTVHNGPTNTDRPLIAGSPRAGAQLAAEPGGWEGNPAFDWQWLRCPATVPVVGDATGCVGIPGATGPRYLLTEADAGHRAVVRVTATNAAGTVSAFSAATGLIASAQDTRDRTAPVLKKVLLTRRRLIFAKGKKAGTSLRFSTDEGGKLTIVIEKPRKRKKAKPKHIVSLTAAVKSGRSTVPLGAVIAAAHLPRGSYRVTITVRDAAGNLSKPASVKFKVLRH